MRAEARWLACAVSPLALLLLPEPAIAGGPSCVREEYVNEWIDNPTGVWDCTSDPDSEVTCPAFVQVKIRRTYCDGTFQSTGTWGPAGCPACPATAAWMAQNPTGLVFTDPCGEASCEISPFDEGVCDGTDPVVPVDPGCQEDYDPDGPTCARDPYPVHYGSGRVETKEVTAFSAPSIAGLGLEVSLRWGSHTRRQRALAYGGDSVPTVHSSAEDTHFVGENWIDNYSDRLIISGTSNPADVITWVGKSNMVSFYPSSTGGYVDPQGRFALVDRGAATPRYVVTALNSDGNPHYQWGFTPASFVRRSGDPFTMARLVRRSVAASSTDYVGFYALAIARHPDGRIDTVTDNLGRQLRYTHELVGTLFYRLASVQYVAYAAATPVTVATFGYTLLDGGPTQEQGWHLDRLDMASSYRRFRYLRFGNVNLGLMTKCDRCDGMLTDVIVPTSSLASTEPQAPATLSEVVTERHEYEYSEDPLAPLPRATRSSGVGGAFAYVYNDDDEEAIQFDLGNGGASCGSGCAAGYQCYAAALGGDDKCYVATTRSHDIGYRVTETSSSTGTTTSTHYGMLSGAPVSSTDDAGVRTTYGFGTDGQLRCLVRNDDDEDAFSLPDEPDSSPCDPPLTGPSQVIRLSHGGTFETKQIPSILNVGGSTTVTRSVGFGPNVVTQMETGYTRDINGTTASETHVRAETFDTLWRPVSSDGPRSNTAAYDVTDIAYHTTPGTLDYGLVSSVTRYVGTASAHTALTTTYSQYDAWGVPHVVVGPGGQSVLLTASADRMTWTIANRDTLGNVVGTSEVVLNPDGTLRSAKDPDGVCLTYEYRSASGVYVGAPTVIKRSTGSSCGVIPIAQSSGEVELRTYVNDDARRLASITRKMNAATQFTYSGFTYDAERRLAGATTLDSAQPYSFEFTNGIPTATTAPGGAGGGGWRTETGADAFGRPTHLWRMLNAAGTSKQAYTFEYATDFTPRPTRLIRGSGATQVSITDFVYDDFGRLVESSVPEQKNPGPGITRFEYDVAGNLVKERVGVGTALVRTSARTYDSLGRLLSVDHDTEHPVNCASAPSGTKIQDEEYRYDSCTGDYPSGTCANTLGRLTISRAVLHCASNQTIKRGKWYSYDNAGRLSSVKYATVTGTTIGTPATVTYTYTSAGRLQSLTSPLSTTYGTKYSYSGSGLVSTVETSAMTPSPIASSLTYRAFGPLTSLTTPVTLPGPKTLKLEVTRRSDDAISTLSWKTTGTPTYFINQTFTYTPAGLIQLRDDNFAAATRYYEYDALQRMTCEAKASGAIKVNPSAADCDSHAPATIRTVGKYTYRDGTSSTAPPDVRATAFTQTAGYVNTGNETYTYTGGSGMITGVNRAIGNMTIAHDVIGRRIYDYDNFDATRSRRDYTYLPNGQLASISGQTSTSVAYSVAVNYDTDGHPLTISETGGGQPNTTYELFYDDASHLLAAQITVASATPKYVTWHYHYLGDTPLAATRTIQLGTGSPTVKRFWFISDERGLIYRGLDDQGVEYWNAYWDATGWRTVNTQSGGPIDMWIPFGMRGQLVVGMSFAYSSNGTVAHTRPPIALNMWRGYDPLTGGFLQPDSMDRGARLSPEGYLYGRGMLNQLADATGAESDDAPSASFPFPSLIRPTTTFDFVKPSCIAHAPVIITALNIATKKISECTSGACSSIGDAELNRRWVHQLQTMRIHCPEYSWSEIEDRATVVEGLFRNVDSGVIVPAFSFPRDLQIGDQLFGWDTYLAPGLFDYPRYLDANFAPRNLECKALMIAHEALHGVIYYNRIDEFDTEIWTPRWPYDPESSEETLIDRISEQCITGCR